MSIQEAFEALKKIKDNSYWGEDMPIEEVDDVDEEQEDRVEKSDYSYQ